MAVLDGSSGNYLFDHYQNHRNTSNKYLPPIPIVVLLSFPCLKQLSFVKCTFPVTIPLKGAQFLDNLLILRLQSKRILESSRLHRNGME